MRTRLCASACAAALAVLLAPATGRADAPAPGGLTPLPAGGPCLVNDQSIQAPDATCGVFRRSNRPSDCVNCLRGIAMSPDGLDVYVADGGSSTLIDLRRDPATGAFTQPAGPGGCTSGSGLNGCARARDLAGGKRGKGQRALPALTGIAISPDGRNVYATASTDIDQSRVASVLAFARDPSTGALAQLPGKAGCLSDHDPKCTPGRALTFARGLVISPDGANVYVEEALSPAQVAVLRRSGDGRLHQLAGRPGCLGFGRRSPCTKLSSGGEDTLALAPDGRQAYIASGDSDDISVYARLPGGALQPRQRCIPYIGTKPCGNTGVGQFISLSLSPDGSSLYLIEGVSDRVDAFARDPATGGLTRLPGAFGCGRSTPCPGSFFAAISLAVAPDGQTAYYVLSGADQGRGGGIVAYHRTGDGSLTSVGAPFSCIATGINPCQSAPGLEGNTEGVRFSPDGRFAYAYGDSALTGFAVTPAAGP